MEEQNKESIENKVEARGYKFVFLIIIAGLLLALVILCLWQNKKLLALEQKKNILAEEKNDIDEQLLNSIIRVENLQSEIRGLKEQISFFEENNQNLTFDKNYDWQEYKGDGYSLKFPKDWQYLTCMDGVQFFLYPKQIEKETCDAPRVNYPFSIIGPGSLPGSVEMAVRTKEIKINGIDAVRYFKIPSGQDLSSNIYVDLIAVPIGNEFYKIYLKNGVEDFTMNEVVETFVLK